MDVISHIGVLHLAESEGQHRSTKNVIILELTVVTVIGQRLFITYITSGLAAWDIIPIDVHSFQAFVCLR